MKDTASVSIPATNSVLRYLQLGIAFQANFEAFSAAGQQRHTLPCLVDSELHLSMAKYLCCFYSSYIQESHVI